MENGEFEQGLNFNMAWFLLECCLAQPHDIYNKEGLKSDLEIVISYRLGGGAVSDLQSQVQHQLY